MKIILSLMTILFATMSRATILETNQNEKKIYMHPTPTLELSLLNLDADGGVLFVFLNYDSDTTKNEIESLKISNPNFQIQPVMAESSASMAKLRLLSIHLSEDLSMRQGQMGPYINAQIKLNKDQVAKLKSLSENTADQVSIEIESKSKYQSQQVLEEYHDDQICSQMNATNLRKVIDALVHLQQPSSIKYPQTFTAFKNSILEKCFETQQNTILSFKELLETPVSVRKPQSSIAGNYTQLLQQTKVLKIKPLIKFEIN